MVGEAGPGVKTAATSVADAAEVCLRAKVLATLGAEGTSTARSKNSRSCSSGGSRQRTTSKIARAAVLGAAGDIGVKVTVAATGAATVAAAGIGL